MNHNKTRDNAKYALSRILHYSEHNYKMRTIKAKLNNLLLALKSDGNDIFVGYRHVTCTKKNVKEEPRIDDRLTWSISSLPYPPIRNFNIRKSLIEENSSKLLFDITQPFDKVSLQEYGMILVTNINQQGNLQETEDVNTYKMGRKTNGLENAHH